MTISGGTQPLGEGHSGREPAGQVVSPGIYVAGADQVALLAKLHAKCFADGWTAADFARLLAMPGTLALVAGPPGEEPDSLKAAQYHGFVLLRTAGPEAEILTIGIVPDQRRAGLGRALLDAIFATSASLKVEELFIEVDAENIPALALYRGAGFVECGVRRNYYSYSDGTTADALTMRCTLPLRS